MRCVRATGLALLGLVASILHAGATKPGGLLVNGDFEHASGTAIPGWTYGRSPHVAVSLSPEARCGKRCLRMRFVRLPKKRRCHSIVSNPFALAWGKTYRLTAWLKGEGFSPSVLFSLAVDLRPAGGQPFPHRREYRCIYLETRHKGWHMADLVFTLPNTTASPAELSGRITGLFMNGPDGALATVCLDRLSLSEFTVPAAPPGARTWRLPAELYGQGGRFVPDSAKVYPGRALHLQSGVHPTGCKYGGPNIYDQPPGKYKVTFRFKVSDNRSSKPVVFVDYAGQGMLNASCLSGRTLRACDFKAPNTYQEFTIYALRAPRLGVQYRFTWYTGVTDVWFDGVTVTQLAGLQDRDLVAYYPVPARSVNIKRKTGAWLVRGLFTREWHVTEALQRAGFTSIATHYFQHHGSSALSPPLADRQWDAAPGIVVLSNVDADCLGFDARYHLCRYVQAGGKLLMLGGLTAFGRGGLRGSFLEELVPFRITRTFDLVRLSAPQPITPGGNLAQLRIDPGVLTGARVKSLWVHDACALRPGARTYLRCGSRPFAVGWRVGRGSVLCCVGAPLGVPPKGSTGFWQWSGWPSLLANLIRRF